MEWYQHLTGWYWMVVSNIFYFHPDPWGNDPIWLIFFKWVGWFNHQHPPFFGAVPQGSCWIHHPTQYSSGIHQGGGSKGSLQMVGMLQLGYPCIYTTTRKPTGQMENHHFQICWIGDTSSFMVVISIVMLVFRGVYIPTISVFFLPSRFGLPLIIITNPTKGIMKRKVQIHWFCQPSKGNQQKGSLAGGNSNIFGIFTPY